MIYQKGTEPETFNVAAVHFSTIPLSTLPGEWHHMYGAYITNNLSLHNHSWKEGSFVLYTHVDKNSLLHE
jgi:hypothetical protein